jgi:HEAT repeat protein
MSAPTFATGQGRPPPPNFDFGRKTVRGWLQAFIFSDTSSAGEEARWGLSEYYHVQRVGITSLLNALEDPDDNVRAGVAIFLGEDLFPPDGEGVTPALVRALERDPSTYMRTEAARCVGMRIGGLPVILKSLLRSLKEDKEPNVREAAAVSLWNARDLSSDLPLDDPRAAAAVFLRNRKTEQEAVDGLIAALQDPVPRVRVAAAQALPYFGHRRGVIPALVHALKDHDLYVHLAAARVLGWIGPIDVPEMVKAFANDDPFVRMGIADSIGCHRDVELPKLLHRPLIRLLHDPDHLVRIRAAAAMVRSNLTSPEVIPAIAEVLADKDERLRSLAVGLLYYDRKQETAQAALLKALRDPAPAIRRQAATALADKSAQLDNILPALVALLEDPDDLVREEAARGLGILGARARQALPALRKALNEASADCHEAAADAIAAIDPLEGARLGILEILVPDVGPYLTDPLAPKDWGTLRFHSRAIGSGPGYLFLEAECFRDQWETGYVLRGKVDLAHLTKASLKVTDLREVTIRYTDLDRATDGVTEKDIPALIRQLYEPRHQAKVREGADIAFSLPMKKLMRLGAKARPAMHKALADPRIRNEAAIILGAIGDESTVPLLISLYPESDRRKTRQALAAYSPGQGDSRIYCLTAALTYLTGQVIGRDREGTDYDPENGRLWREWWARARDTFRVPNPRPYATCYPNYPEFK